MNDGGGGGPQAKSPRAPSMVSGVQMASSGMQSMSEWYSAKFPAGSRKYQKKFDPA